MPSENKYKHFLIKELIEEKKYDFLAALAKEKTEICKAELKKHLDDIKNTKKLTEEATDEELQELLILLKTGTVQLTLAELDDFIKSCKSPADPPLAWRT